MRKWDGAEFRVVSSGEYIQMSGRAGRRGLDERGIVICMLEEALDPAVAKAMLKGESDVLNSSFHLGYNMLLNLLRVEDVNPVNLMARSFHQFQSTRRTPEIVRRIEAKEREREELRVRMATEGGEGGAQYAAWMQQVDDLRLQVRDVLCQPVYVVPFLNPGRLAKVRAGKVGGGKDWGWTVIVGYQVKAQRRGTAHLDPASYVMSVLARAALPLPLKARGPPAYVPAPPHPAPGEWLQVEVGLEQLDSLSTIRLLLPKDLRDRAARKQVGVALQQVVDKWTASSMPTLTPADMKANDPSIPPLLAQLTSLESCMASHPLHSPASIPLRTSLHALHRSILTLDADLTSLARERHAVSEDVVMAQQLTQMQVVLRSLSCTTAHNVMDVKGRVAAEVSTCDELVAAELMLSGYFLGMDVPVLVAACSVLVMNERVEEEEKKLRPLLLTPYTALIQTARRVAEVQRTAGLDIDLDDYLARFSPTLMEVVYAWCKGAKFSEVMKLTDVFEGTIIRCMRRLEELLRQLGNASKAVGSEELEAKFLRGIELLKRDIVFAASLYL